MFDDLLELRLQLNINNQDYKIPGANIKSFDIAIYPYGYSASLSFWVSAEVSADEMFPNFIKPGQIKVSLEMEARIKPKDAKPEPLRLQGIVTGKAVIKELTIETTKIKGNPVLYRLYKVDFKDAASVLWTRHFPFALVVDAGVKDLIDAAKVSGVDLKYDWKILEDKYPINTLSCGTMDNSVSFYDFIIWYTSYYNGAFIYDTKKNQYTMAAQKLRDGSPVSISGLEIADYSIEFPEAGLSNIRAYNVVAEGFAKREGKQENALHGIWRDMLVREPIAADFDKLFDLTESKNKDKDHIIYLQHKRFPLITFRPDIFLEMEGGLWSDKIFLKGKKYRLCDIFIKGNAVDAGPDADHNMAYTTYHVKMTSRLELKDDPVPNLPSFKSPVYPVAVEGLIVSDQGKNEEETYHIYQNDQTKLDYLKVKLPAFENKIVTVPFEPMFDTGHFYFTPYKNEKALIELYFHDARIARFLDWRPEARLPMDTQGNHILMGKGKDSKTSVDHVYTDDKPKFSITRKSKKDTEIIQLAEGTIILQTKEEN
ncbi:MAG: hypothetical protein HGB33_04060 [Syntrophaceae bacterium]|nr:hypothetical protein [Syntrophaceae bacterium]NTW76943.1 hypothetical protein [Syntrophaceae bacterium]